MERRNLIDVPGLAKAVAMIKLVEGRGSGLLVYDRAAKVVRSRAYAPTPSPSEIR